MEKAQFNGTDAERTDMVVAIGHNCTCIHDEGGERTFVCPPHKALEDQQRFGDGLLAYRYMRDRLQNEEFAPQEEEEFTC